MVTSDSKNEQQRTDVKRERFSLCLVFITKLSERTDVKRERFSLCLVFITKLSGLRLSHDVRLEDFVA